MESSCEPPCKKLCQSQDGDAHSNSQPASNSSPAPKGPVAPSAGADAHDLYDEGLDSDEFESLEELVAASQNSQATSAPEIEANTSAPSTAEIDLAGPKVEATQHGHTASAVGVAAKTAPVSYTEADLEIPKIDACEESDDSMVIDLTRDDAELQVRRSDGFIGVIKPGTPGITVKCEGSFHATPARRTLAPLSTNAPPHRVGNQKSIQPELTPETRHSKSIKSEDAEISMPPLAHTPSGLNHECPATPAQGHTMGLIKTGHEDKTPARRKRVADGSLKLTSSSGIDMTKFTVNEHNLASMPRAAHVPQLKTRLLDHQRQVIRIPHQSYLFLC